MGFRPTGKYLSVIFRPPRLKSKGGLYLSKPVYSQIAIVDAVGSQVEDIKAGDTVMMHKHGDGMIVQNGLWYHYFKALGAKTKTEFKIPPVIVTDEDIFGRWDDKIGLIPHRRNIVLTEFREKIKVKGIIRIFRHRQERRPIGIVERISSKVDSIKIDNVIVLGKYGGAYFEDLDGTEKVLLAASEILGTLTGYNKKTKIIISEPREQHDPQIGSQFLNQ